MKVLKGKRIDRFLALNFILASWVILCVLTDNQDSCLPENFTMCTCSGNTLTCSGLSDADVLAAAVESSNGPTTLKLIDSELPALPPGLFNKSGITNFRIENTTLPFLSLPDGTPSPFSNGSSLSDFTADGVRYPYSWNWTLLNSLPSLNTIRIVNSDLVYINPSFRSLNISSLNVLVIENSEVRWISDGAFASLRHLSFFHAIRNHISVFKRSYMPTPATALSLMNLKKNKLTFIEEDLFSHMPKLTYVNLESNKLVTLSEKLISGKVGRRIFVDLMGNPFHCDCSISWLRKRQENFDVHRIRCSAISNPQGISFMSFNWKDLDC